MNSALINVIAVFHLLVTLLLIGIVLLQNKKGDAIAGGLMGGSSSTIFGSEGPANFLVKATRVLAALFMISSVTLASMQTRRTVVDVIPQAAPVQPATPAAPAGPTQVPGAPPVSGDIHKVPNDHPTAPVNH